MLDFKKLRAANIAREAQWDPQGKLDGPFMALGLGGEAGEALNVVKKLERERLGLGGSRSTVQELAEELADVLAYTDLVAHMYGINLSEAYIDKYNKVCVRLGISVRMLADGTTTGEGYG